MLADYHIHSRFSDDSLTPINRQVEKAIEMGLDEICFTDHVDYGIKKDWDEAGRLSPLKLSGIYLNANYPVYFKELEEARKKYEGRIMIRGGLEFGMQVHTVDRFRKLYENWQDQLDFILLSCHQVNDLELHNGNYYQGKTVEEANIGYYHEIYEVMNRYQNYSVLAHLDLPARHNREPFPFAKQEPLVAAILKKAIADGKGIEVNTSCYRYKLPDLTPSTDILHLYKDLGGRIITVGSDSHRTLWTGYKIKETCRRLYEEFGFTEICTYEKMVPRFHVLRESL